MWMVLGCVLPATYLHVDVAAHGLLQLALMKGLLEATHGLCSTLACYEDKNGGVVQTPPPSFRYCTPLEAMVRAGHKVQREKRCSVDGAG